VITTFPATALCALLACPSVFQVLLAGGAAGHVGVTGYFLLGIGMNLASQPSRTAPPVPRVRCAVHAVLPGGPGSRMMPAAAHIRVAVCIRPSGEGFKPTSYQKVVDGPVVTTVIMALPPRSQEPRSGCAQIRPAHRGH
jgi:hypothetical protein